MPKFQATHRDNPKVIIALPSDMTKLVEMLKCAMCKQFPCADTNAIVFSCGNGHLACQKCFEVIRGKMCIKINDDGGKLCSLPFTPIKGPMDPFQLFLSRNSTYECHFKGRGCHKAVIGHEFNRHIETCSFGYSYSCFNASCSESDLFSAEQMRKHLETAHFNLFALKNPDMFNVLSIKEEEWDAVSREDKTPKRMILSVMEVFGETFILAGEEFQNKVALFVQVVNGNAVANKFEATLRINFDRRQEQPDHTWKILGYEEDLRTALLKPLINDKFVVKVKKSKLRQFNPTKLNDTRRLTQAKDRTSIFESFRVEFGVNKVETEQDPDDGVALWQLNG